MYFNAFSLSSIESNNPIPTNDSVLPIPGLHTSGNVKVSPNAPVPFAFGINNLYLSRFST